MMSEWALTCCSMAGIFSRPVTAWIKAVLLQACGDILSIVHTEEARCSSIRRSWSESWNQPRINGGEAGSRYNKSRRAAGLRELSCDVAERFCLAPLSGQCVVLHHDASALSDTCAVVECVLDCFDCIFKRKKTSRKKGIQFNTF